MRAVSRPCWRGTASGARGAPGRGGGGGGGGAGGGRAARAAVDEKHTGRVAPVVSRHALAASVRTMFGYDPEAALAEVRSPLLVLVAEAGGAGDETARARRPALGDLLPIPAAAGHPPVHVVRYGGVAHNVMRYRPDEVSAELLGLLVAAAAGDA